MPRPIFLVFSSLLSAVVALACAYANLSALVPAAVFAGTVLHALDLPWAIDDTLCLGDRLF